jgi:hypothetical protein
LTGAVLLQTMILIIISDDENSYENVSVSVVKSKKRFSSIIVEIETLVLYKIMYFPEWLK